MNDMRLERLLDDVLADIATVRVPDRTRSRHRLHHEPRPAAPALARPHRGRRPCVSPHRSPSGRRRSGSPFVVALTLALSLAVAGAVAVGASLLPEPLHGTHDGSDHRA